MFARKTLSLPDNIQLSYLEWNQGKEPLLLLHGLADHALVWRSLGDHLAEDYHIIAPDLRGHGETSKPKAGYGFDEVIGDLQALIAHLNWHSAHVLGHSWGGKLGCVWTMQNPEQIRSLILVDPIFIGSMPSWMKFTFPLLYRVLPFLKGMGPFASYEEAEKQARQLKQYRSWTDFQKQVFQAGIEEKSDGTWGSKFVIPARDGIFEEVMNVPGLTQYLDLPALFIQPKGGVNRTEIQLKPYKTYLTQLQIRKVPSHHWAFLSEPEIFNQTVASFLREIGSLRK
ncbi:MAG: alpha/beta hydrolase [Cyanobacteria bacterium SBLK]|nr:alpha/beta hydrolase [Cyanobacteria bacterium SBLK]